MRQRECEWADKRRKLQRGSAKNLVEFLVFFAVIYIIIINSATFLSIVMFLI